MNFLTRGFWSGVFATSTMTLSMFRMYNALPGDQKQALPPAILTKEIDNKTGILPTQTSERRIESTLVSHFGFGASCAILYALLSPRVQMRPIVKGSLYALGIWSSSYLGWIPGLGLKPAAQRTSVERNGMMILAHLVWGATLGYSEARLRWRGHQMLDGGKIRA